MYQIENGKEWDEELYHTLMDKRIRSSKEAKDIKQKLEYEGALPTLPNHYDWLMLCVSYCLIHRYGQNEQRKIIPAPDTAGTEISSGGFKTAFQEYHHLWLAVLSDTLFEIKGSPCTANDLGDYIHNLWHTGAVELDKFWQRCKEFKPDSELAQRQEFLSELVKMAAKNSEKRRVIKSPNSFSSSSDPVRPLESDLVQTMTKVLQSMGKGVQRLVFQESGVRYDFYLLQFSEYNDWDKIHERFCSALGMEENAVVAERKTGLSHAYKLKIKRPENTWQHLDKVFLQTALQQYSGNAVLPLCLGADEIGKPVFDDLHKARHILVGGTTGAGKSVMVRTLLHSLFELIPSEKAEIAIFDSANDYAVFKDKQNLWNGEIHGNRDEMRGLLETFVEEMDNRLNMLKEYNATEIRLLPENIRPKYLIILVEELAALLDNDKEAEKPLVQLLQEGRKTGIHLIMATQEPDSKTFSARLRANIPSRIALKVSKPGSSEMILGETGAENLLGRGDHLVKWDNGTPFFLHGFDV
ncbi:FtsK/SpoIIIE domain-containing protein [Neisseria sp.]|uniref:FtsK/SpoIIIE domain-containing protein n=1 Tax=Neisseria sp. TaxID=192066 RepID=UPI002898432F|nr:FtsK/SpoIIIE domain-containing protein [Neisseria sp.]